MKKLNSMKKYVWDFGYENNYATQELAEKAARKYAEKYLWRKDYEGEVVVVGKLYAKYSPLKVQHSKLKKPFVVYMTYEDNIRRPISLKTADSRARKAVIGEETRVAAYEEEAYVYELISSFWAKQTVSVKRKTFV